MGSGIVTHRQDLRKDKRVSDNFLGYAFVRKDGQNLSEEDAILIRSNGFGGTINLHEAMNWLEDGVASHLSLSLVYWTYVYKEGT